MQLDCLEMPETSILKVSDVPPLKKSRQPLSLCYSLFLSLWLTVITATAAAANAVLPITVAAAAAAAAATTVAAGAEILLNESLYY